MMKKRTKMIWLTVILVIGTPITFIYLSITNSVDCSQMVIDTYEIHSNIDIPSVSFINCYYDEGSDTRISVYDLNSAISMRKFKRLDLSKNSDFLAGSFLLSKQELPKSTDLYIATGEKRGTKWTYLLDKNTQRLWAELKY